MGYPLWPDLVDRITDEGTRRTVLGQVIELRAGIEDAARPDMAQVQGLAAGNLETLLRGIDQVYSSIPRSVVDASGPSTAAVAKEIARIIYLNLYRLVDIQTKLARHTGRDQ